MSVIQFGDKARMTYEMRKLQDQPPALNFGGGNTAFVPPASLACKLTAEHGPKQGYTTVIVFMSDGVAGDAAEAAKMLKQRAEADPKLFASYTVGFGDNASRTLESMAFANGVQEKTNYRTANVGNLGQVFEAVAARITPGRLQVRVWKI